MRVWTMPALLVAFFAVVAGGWAADTGGDKAAPKGMTSKAVEAHISILKASKKPDELADALNALTREQSAASLDYWLKCLRDPSFLERLDPEVRRRPRLERVLDFAARLQAEKANQILLALASSKEFMEDVDCEGALLRACAHVRQPSEKLLDFLDGQAVPDSWQANGIVRILAKMRSEAACRRIEKRFLSPDTESGFKKTWLTHELLEARNDPAIVSLYGRLIKSTAKDAPLRELIILSLFDYLPIEWYPYIQRVPSVPKPPARYEASTAALEELLRIADFSAKLDLSAYARASVKEERKAIEEILKFRSSGAPERIAKLIAELDNEQYRVREKATLDLSQIGERAGPLLRKALRTPRSLEARARIERLLDKITDPETAQRISALAENLAREDERSQYRLDAVVRQLRQFGELAGPALSRALESTKSARTRELIASILADME